MMTGEITDELPATCAPPLRILVVDDNHDSADTLAHLLNLFGYDAKATYDASALDLARSFSPHVFLIDLVMPQMTGFTMARKVREQVGEDSLLIAVTGHHSEHSQELATEAGFSHYLRKPVDRFQLQRILDGWARDTLD